MPEKMNSLEKSAQRVQDFLSANGYECSVKELSGSTRTAQDAAEAVGCTVGQIAKSLIFKNKKSGDPVLVIASGANRVDVKKIKRATGIELGRADGTYVKELVGYAIGGVPPVGHTVPLRTILDPDLKNYEQIWAAAGTPHALFRLDPAKLDSMTGGTWVDLKE
jgi:prolyl-tRNA editing enzyme YbaK/EbsC (Cys-tRNA(Pro) deacylase)